jgi:hypothetical protein
VLFFGAAALVAAAALMRTWASSYLDAGVVYASEVKSDSLVAEGPYRWVRNPLYFANILMVVGMGSMMSRAGCIVAVALMVTYCYRLILREESELEARQGVLYEAYGRAVPRLLPAFTPRIPSGTARPRWSAGFAAEAWYFGFAASVAAFGATLNLKVFFVILALSLVLFWGTSAALRKRE